MLDYSSVLQTCSSAFYKLKRIFNKFKILWCTSLTLWARECSVTVIRLEVSRSCVKQRQALELSVAKGSIHSVKNSIMARKGYMFSGLFSWKMRSSELETHR